MKLACRHCKEPWDCVFRMATETSPCKMSKLPIFPTHRITTQNLMTSSDSKGAFIHMWQVAVFVNLMQESYISKISAILVVVCETILYYGTNQVNKDSVKPTHLKCLRFQSHCNSIDFDCEQNYNELLLYFAKSFINLLNRNSVWTKRCKNMYLKNTNYKLGDWDRFCRSLNSQGPHINTNNC